MKSTKSENIAASCPELRGNLNGIKFPAFAEIKYDGEYNIIEYRDGHGFCINKYGTVKADFPALNNITKNLQCSSVTLLAEVYTNDGKSGELYTFLTKKKSDDLKIYVFDIKQLNGVDLSQEDLLTRKEMLWDTVGKEQAQCKIVNDKTEAMEFFIEKTDEGFEGIVVKPFDSKLVMGPCDWAKIKFKDQTDYKVVSIDPHKERIEVAVPIVGTTPIGASPQSHINVGVKAPNRYKRHIKLGDIVTIEHQGILMSGSLRHPVLIAKKEWR